MTTQYYPAATRPPGISELIKRLQKNTLDARESEALRALCQTAVKQVLNGANIPTFAWEAARLAEVVPEPDSWETDIRSNTQQVCFATRRRTPCRLNYCPP